MGHLGGQIINIHPVTYKHTQQSLSPGYKAQKILKQVHQRTCLGMFIAGFFWGGSGEQEGGGNGK